MSAPVERLFLAVPIDPAARAALRDRLTASPLPGRVVPPENWHLTVRFIGAVEGKMRPLLEDALGAAVLGPELVLRFDRLHGMPNAARARVLALGLTPDDGAAGLAALAAIVDQAVRRAGLAPEERPFHAHLTLARLDPPADVSAGIRRAGAFGINTSVRELVLFRSHLGQGVPRHVPVASWGLGGA